MLRSCTATPAFGRSTSGEGGHCWSGQSKVRNKSAGPSHQSCRVHLSLFCTELRFTRPPYLALGFRRATFSEVVYFFTCPRLLFRIITFVAFAVDIDG
eukprot:scaffold118281_cov69-Phaeocystis_antarctica.AAC.3